MSAFPYTCIGSEKLAVFDHTAADGCGRSMTHGAGRRLRASVALRGEDSRPGEELIRSSGDPADK